MTKLERQEITWIIITLFFAATIIAMEYIDFTFKIF